VTQLSDDELVGQVIENRYRIESALGSGGMGMVYRARHVKVGREVAIKILHDHLLGDPEMVERFEREAAIAARLAHKNLVAVLDVGETPTRQKLMVLELARGRSLDKLIAEGPMARDRVVALTAQLLDGLDYAHAAGLVHRDLKPENVIVEIDDRLGEVPRIVDFGIAMPRGDDHRRLTATGIVMGTPQYMAPEHAQGHDVDPRSDLFALGVMVYEMLAGRLPFDGSGVEAALANMTSDPPPIADRAGVVVDPLLERFARRLMARRIESRFHTARAALDVLELIDRHPEAAREILCPRPRATAPRLAPIREPKRIALGTGAPLRRLTPALRARPVATGSRRALGLAATVEAPGTTKRRSRRSRRGARAWQPWKSFGLITGAVLAVLTALGIGSCVPIESTAVPAIPQPMAAPEVRMAVRMVDHEPVAEPVVLRLR